MSQFNKSFKDRLLEKSKAKEQLAENYKKIITKPLKKNKIKKVVLESQKEIDESPREVRPWAGTRTLNAREYKTRISNEKITAQPWTQGLIDAVLEAADLGATTLCLVWPAKVNTVPLLHGLANIERVFAKDLRGLRTLLYPGTHTYRSSLQGVLTHRQSLCSFYMSLWETRTTGTNISAATLSESFQAALFALNDIQLKNPDLPDPSLAELVPGFIFDATKKIWATTTVSPIERTLCKVNNFANRNDLRKQIGTEWTSPEKAPGAIFVLHNETKKESWKSAFKHSSIKPPNSPEVILLDATQTAARTNYKAVNRIPDFLLFAKENGLENAGAVIVTDDPKAFFDLQYRLRKLKLDVTSKVWAAESEELMSAHPVSASWYPENRSNSNFSISIVDRDASQVSLAFQKMAIELKDDNGDANQALMKACWYILRLSNIPAGYRDVTEMGGLDFVSQLNSWGPVKDGLMRELSSGKLNRFRSDLEKIISKAEDLIDTWSDATPMALRLIYEIRRQKITFKNRISIVLPNKKYVLMTHEFLKRKMTDDWLGISQKIAWHTLSSVSKTLSSDSQDHLIFVGMNSSVLRILITHLHVPHGTAVLIAYRQAESSLKLLEQMKDIESFKAYRGRIGLMIQSLERRLNEVPHPIRIDKLQDMSTLFQFTGSESSQPQESSSYKLLLEGKGQIYISGWAYRYIPDEDPSFKRVAVSALKLGDLIFYMSDEIRTEIEVSLNINDESINSHVDPARALLKLYHSEIQTRCSLMFGDIKRSKLARVIREKMISIDPSVEKCRGARIYYWLQLQANGDTRPHAPNDSNYFRIFCKALGVNEDNSNRYWMWIRNSRLVNQSAGRELVSRYAEILFQPESAKIYRKMTDETIHKIQQESLKCVYRIDNIIPPA